MRRCRCTTRSQLLLLLLLLLLSLLLFLLSVALCRCLDGCVHHCWWKLKCHIASFPFDSSLARQTGHAILRLRVKYDWKKGSNSYTDTKRRCTQHAANNLQHIKHLIPGTDGSARYITKLAGKRTPKDWKALIFSSILEVLTTFHFPPPRRQHKILQNYSESNWRRKKKQISYNFHVTS